METVIAGRRVRVSQHDDCLMAVDQGSNIAIKDWRYPAKPKRGPEEVQAVAEQLARDVAYRADQLTAKPPTRAPRFEAFD